MKRRDRKFAVLPSPLRLFFTVLIIVFLAEAATMLLLELFPPRVHPVIMSIADASLMIGLSAPFVWWFIVRPLRSVAVTEHERAATVLEHALDGIITIDEQGLVVSFNPAAERIFGYAAEEVLGKPLTPLMPERYRAAHERGLERVRSTGERSIIGKIVEMHGLRKDGREFPLEVSLATWTTGTETFYTGIIRDATERKQAERELAKRAMQLQALRAVTVEITKELNLKTLLGLVTRHAAELLGARAGVVYFWEEATQVLSPQAWSGFGEWMREVHLRLGEGLAGAVAKRRQGMIVNDYWSSPYASPLFIERTRFTAAVAEPILYQDRLIGVILINNERTGQQFIEEDRELLSFFAAQAAIAIENARLYAEAQGRAERIAAINRLTKVISSSLDLGSVYEAFAHEVKRLIPYERMGIVMPDDSAEGLLMFQLATDRPFAAAKGSVWAKREGTGIDWVMSHRQPSIERDLAKDRLFVEDEILMKEGIRSSVRLPLIAKGSVIGALFLDSVEPARYAERDLDLLVPLAGQLAVAIDNARLYEEVSEFASEMERKVEERTKELKEAQVQLIQSAKLAAVGTLAAGVAHELNQPLMVIRGYAQELLAGERIAAEEAREDLRRIETQTGRMSAIITHLKDFSRQSKGKRQHTDLNHVVAQALTFLGQQLKMRNINVVRELDSALPAVWADPLQIEQVLLNLVTNARDAMEAAGGGTVTIHTDRAQDGRIALAVTDTGPGIPPHLQGRIFDPFFTTKEVGKGTGLGLSICHGIVEEHEGELRLESPVANGRGARFTILLPLSPRDPAERDRE